ncbi:MAG: hypothetical protein KGL53_11530, partial [Elusimicrobia bacterium]|nr:hypothetical protein [Elusimicrobiota bacterium]
QALAWLTPDSPGGLATNDFVLARITMGVRRGVLTVPAPAVLKSGGKTIVLRASGPDGERRYEVVPVRTGAQAEGRVEVLSGLAAGDEVVTQGGLGHAFPDFKAAGD